MTGTAGTQTTAPRGIVPGNREGLENGRCQSLNLQLGGIPAAFEGEKNMSVYGMPGLHKHDKVKAYARSSSSTVLYAAVPASS